MTATPESITERGGEAVTVDELTAALVHVEHSGGKDGCASCRGKAISLLSHVLAHREPEYEPGEIYLSTNGYRYMRLPDSQWLVLYERGVTDVRPDNQPLKPLRKLVPLPGREDLVKAVTPGVLDDYAPDAANAVADAVLRLLEGGSDD